MLAKPSKSFWVALIECGETSSLLERILRGETVRRKTLAKIVKQLQLYRETEKTELDQ